MSHLPADWTRDRLKDVAAINADSLPADTDSDYEFDYLEISNVDYYGIVDSPRLNDCATKMHPRGHGDA